MSTLVKEFAEKVYLEHGIDTTKEKNPRLSYENFSNWIKSHKKLYKSYYSAFHTEIWTIQDDEPTYMSLPVDLEFTGRIEYGKTRCTVYGFQI